MREDSDSIARVAPRTQWAGRPLVHVATTGSTNDLAREAARAGAPHGYAAVADEQTAGRGRRGRVWHSPPGANLYLSVLLRPSMEVSDAPVLALVAGLAVARACERFVEPSSVTLKWPNDVRIHRMKTAGILVEGSIREGVFDTAVVGVGLNVHPRPWPPELTGRATCLGEHTTVAELSRATVLEALLEELERAVDAMLSGSRAALMAEVRARCDTLSTVVRVDDTEGVAERLDDDGALAVRRADGALVLVRSGEVV